MAKKQKKHGWEGLLAKLGPDPEPLLADKALAERLHGAMPKATPETLKWLSHFIAGAVERIVHALNEAQRPNHLTLDAQEQMREAARQVFEDALLDELDGGCLTVSPDRVNASNFLVFQGFFDTQATEFGRILVAFNRIPARK